MQSLSASVRKNHLYRHLALPGFSLAELIFLVGCAAQRPIAQAKEFQGHPKCNYDRDEGDLLESKPL